MFLLIMDPLSVAASTLTILSTLESIFKLVKSFRDAPSQLDALNNEIVDVTAAVKHVTQILKESENKTGASSEKDAHLSLALSNIREKARELEDLLRSCVTPLSSTSDETKVSKISWLKVRSRVQRLQVELRDGKFNLLIALATFTA